MTVATMQMDIDLALLLKQKRALLRAIEKANDSDALLLDGLLNFLDYVHDTIDPPRAA